MDFVTIILRSGKKLKWDVWWISTEQDHLKTSFRSTLDRAEKRLHLEAPVVCHFQLVRSSRLYKTSLIKRFSTCQVASARLGLMLALLFFNCISSNYILRNGTELLLLQAKCHENLTNNSKKNQAYLKTDSLTMPVLTTI